MALRFKAACLPDRVEVTLVKPGLLFGETVRPQEEWLTVAGPLAQAARRLLPLVAEGKATWRGDTLLVDNASAAELPAGVASLLRLPEIAPLLVDIAFHGAISDESSRIETEWRETSYSRISPTRSGIEIRWGERSGRLSEPLLRLLDAIDGFNAAPGKDIDARVARWGEVTKALAVVNPDSVTADSYTKGLTVFQAGSFALDITRTGDGIDFAPVLMSRERARSLEDDAPVLDDEVDAEGGAFEELVDVETSTLLAYADQNTFRRAFEKAEGGVRRSYPLRRSTYLLVEPDLQRALDVVRTMRGATEERKRAFVKNPRTQIALELGLDPGDATVSALFVETKQYSDRVIGLGVWEKPELSWLSKSSAEWLPEKFPVVVDGQPTEITLKEARKLRDDVPEAEAAGRERVALGDAEVTLPVAKEVLRQVADVIHDNRPVGEDGSVLEPEEAVDRPNQPTTPREPVVIKIETNFEDVTYEVSRKAREAVIPLKPPSHLMGRTTFKAHQDEGFEWLVSAWKAGWPGVLLADDMGLGKSFQGLAFLAWLKANRDAAKARALATVHKGPILIVAPTSLLQNWIKEAELHLAAEALGANRADVFGSGIRKFRNPDDVAREQGDTLNRRLLAEQDWILTTYETLADNHVSFAEMKFSAVLFDEMQKVKDPGTLNTWAAKSLNTDFVLGLTGTPIENRIEDLWSIMDRVFPGFLRNLKWFSTTYKDGDLDRYKALSDQMMKPIDGAPAIMLRRMKDDVLEGLPKKTVVPYPTPMPAIQAQAYGDVISKALGSEGPRARGAMLEVVQHLRGISLYPGDAATDDLFSAGGCEAWIGRSARLGKSFEVLRDLERRGEKGLIFVEQRKMQDLLANAMMTTFDMERPLIINGNTPGHKRQGMVDVFQGRRRGFDAMILSPKAAGVGLTITAANHVIHLSRWWNPAVEDQCNDRVYRIGQERPVTIHVPIAVHPALGDKTFDVTLDRLLERKRAMSRNLLMPPVFDTDLDEVFSMSLAA
ncbi:DEAD/DEAH box helicase [Methylorubrum populi]